MHTELARLESTGRIRAVITQNIDRLHSRAGSKKVIELHGSPDPHRCIYCGKEISFNEAALIVRAGGIPYCEVCGGPLKPDIVFFGENLPAHALKSAIDEAMRADLMLVLGSTLLVHPAASIPGYALRNKAHLVIINNMATPLDSSASLKYRNLETVFEYLNKNL